MKHGVTGTINLSSIISLMKNAILFNLNDSSLSGLTASLSLSANNSSINVPATPDPSDPANNLCAYATVMPCSGSLKNLYVYLNANTSALGSIDINVNVNGIPTGIGLSILSDGSGNAVLASDTAHAFPIVAGDLVILDCDFSTIVAGNTAFAGAIEFDT